MKRKWIFYVLVIMSFLLIKMSIVEAATLQLKPQVSKSTLVVGNTVTVTVNLSSSDALGSWEYSLNYDSSKLDLVSSDVPLSYKGVVSSTNQKSVSYQYVFKAKASGKVTFSFSKAAAYAYDESFMTIHSTTSSVTIITQAQLEASYSKNNYLSSLSIDGYDLDPAFHKDVLEYKVSLPPETYQMEIKATKEDSKASLSGIGVKELTDGDNKFEILVTAENGNERKYILTVTVLELSPISVTVEEKEYTVIRKQEMLTCPDGYTQNTVMIGEEEVPSCYSETTKFTLVALKDAEGNISYFIKNNDSYTKYETIEFHKNIIFPTTLPSNIEIPKGYKKTSISINGVKVDAYKLNKTSKFAFIYGLNVDTGESNLYMYDALENTISRYNSEGIELLEKNLNQFLMIIFVLGTVSIILLVSLIITFITKSNRFLRKHRDKKNKIPSNEIE